MQTRKLNDFYLGQDTPASLDELLGFLGDIAQRHTHGFRDDDRWEKGVLIENKREERLQKIFIPPAHFSPDDGLLHPGKAHLF